ncbi:beta-ketoacyl-ACP synthase III [Paenibacillus athensensis]|uniref:3-oxoacyl-ACP synthase n=1 Tax=Paenibacillus athensensis TaxID=1967502 RepID=A0A4Y8Q4S6_9BACL|nr:beta-ketoacyl-ACP synthase III [Paenibacillus athensensis]MCD1258471.1 beta-ketoacyl-ACP synthase III [Paenibacillus athensensis]
MLTRDVKIEGTGKYLPRKAVSAEEMDRRLGVAEGWVRKKTDVAVRYFADESESAAYMGARAAEAALAAAGLGFADIDCLVCASGTMVQPIPCTASLIQEALGELHAGVPAFDLNATCLSFVAALDMLSCLIEAGRYRRVLLVSSEIASKGLNYKQKESAALFGDGACAVVLGRSGPGEQSRILHAQLETHSAGAHLSEIRGGGSRLHASDRSEANVDDYLFDMDGEAIYRMASRLLPAFVDRLLAGAGIRMRDLRLVVPHQGSAMAMRLLRRKLGIAEEQLMYIARDHGNTIAASIPMGLHEAVRQGRISRGDKVLLLGTSAGFSLGGVALAY